MMQKNLKSRAIALLTLLLMIFSTFAFSGCGDKDPNKKSLMLHLAFDEGKGNVVSDSSKNLEDATVQYVFNNAQFLDGNREPEWRKTGVKGGSLLLDGYSNYVKYDYSDIKVRGSALTVSAWVAPRVFEWDNPDAAENGTERLTAVVAQYYKQENQGFILGYQRHGAWSFQVGIGDLWLTLWDNGNPLSKYEWNHIVGVYDGVNGSLRMYLNGVLVNEKTFFEGTKISGAVDEPLMIGKNAYPDSNATASCNMVSGLIDEVKIYSSAISAKDVKSLYDSCEVSAINWDDIKLQNILTSDYTKTQFHGGPNQHWMNEPHSPMYYNGKYHLFFQHNLMGPYFRNICWGHLVSDDMVNWTQLKEVITPTYGSVCPDGVWSGGATYDKKGVPVLFFTAGNDSYSKSSEGLISNQNIGYAYPKDINDPNLTEWVIGDTLAIKQVTGQGRRGEFRDAHCWQEDGKWYMLVGSASTTTNGGTALLYESDVMEVTDSGVNTNWKFRGQLYEIKNQKSDLGSVWELPVLLPLKNEAGTITKYALLISPAPADSADNKIYYFVGQFDKQAGRFIPDAEFEGNPHLLDYGCNVFTGPSGFIDPVSGEAFVMSIMQDQRAPGVVAASGWANCVGLARRIYLNDNGTDLKIEAVSALENYRDKTLINEKNTTIEAVNQKLEGVGSDMMYIKVTFKNVNANAFGIRIKMDKDGLDRTYYYYDATTSTINGGTLNSGANANTGKVSGDLALNEDGTLTMEIYVDRSLVEAFFNSTKAISTRAYSAKDSVGIQLYAEGGAVTVEEILITTVKSIYE